MDSITVKVNDLWAVLNLIKKDGMSQVNVTIDEGDDEYPADIMLEAVSKKEPECGIGYDSVEAVPDNERLI